jgi:hypothetical protein
MQLSSRRGNATIDYKSLISLVRELDDRLNHYLENGETQRAQMLAEAIIQLGFQLARGDEDQVIATLRLGLWDRGFRALAKLKAIDPMQETQILAWLERDLAWIRSIR